MKLNTFTVAIPALVVVGSVAADPVKIQLRSSALDPARAVAERAKARARRAATPEIVLTEWFQAPQDLQWYSNVSVGTPPQNFTVLLDTGSNDLILPRSNCTSCSGHDLFNSSSSSTFSGSPGLAKTGGFDTGSNTHPLAYPANLSGLVVSDTVSIGGLAVASQTFLLCDHYDEEVNLMPMDGVLGLPPVNVSNLSTQTFNSTPLLFQLIGSGQIDPVFSFHLGTGDGDLNRGGELTLGGLDASQYQGSVSYVALNATGVALGNEWFVDQTGVFINGSPVITNVTAGISLLDTGTAFIETPDNATAAAIYAAISPSIYQIDPLGAWGAPCEVLAALNPQITFTIGLGSAAINVTVDRNSFNLGPYTGLNGICQAVILNPVSPLTPDSIGVWTLGSPLLKAYYTVFDAGEQRVGFAQLKAATNSSSSGSGSGSGSGGGSGTGSGSGSGSGSGPAKGSGAAVTMTPMGAMAMLASGIATLVALF